MSDFRFQIQPPTPFAESLIWQLNRDYYNHHGIDAWRTQNVPHQITSNAMVGMTYAELIFGILKDIGQIHGIQEKVYVLELGAGHGRLAYHTLVHLNRLIKNYRIKTPDYCYIISDFAEDNLRFFSEHPQFESFIKKGILDVANFDAINGNQLYLRHSKIRIKKSELTNPIITIANYFFDSIPVDLFHIQNGKINKCSISLHADSELAGKSIKEKLTSIQFKVHKEDTPSDHYQEDGLNKILQNYRGQIFNSYLLFPHHGIRCLNRLKLLSTSGLILLTMDKGQHEVSELDNAGPPDMVTHGSMSMTVNFHAISAYCQQLGGKVKFPNYSTLDLQLGCMIVTENPDHYSETISTYDRFVNTYGPDVINSMKRFAYKHVATMDLQELLGMIRMSQFDSTVFIKLLPRIKQVMQLISRPDRIMLAKTLNDVWQTYFSLKESYDLAFEIGGVLYELAFYTEALVYFSHSRKLYGNTTDEYYNRILCHYQLRQDDRFTAALTEGRLMFPKFTGWAYLDQLDLSAQ